MAQQAPPELLTIDKLKALRAATFAAGDAHARKPGEWTPDDAAALALHQRTLNDIEARIFFVENYTPPDG